MHYWLKLESCCCCFNLRTGSLFVLWFGLVFSVITSVNVLPLLFLKQDQSGKSIILRSFVTMYLVILAIFGIIPSAAGLFGVYKNKTSYLRLYLIVTLVGLVSLLAVALILILMWIFRQEFLKHLLHQLVSTRRKHVSVSNTEPTASVGAIIWSAIFVMGSLDLIEWYYTSVVYNHYLKLKEEEKLHSHYRIQ